MTTTNASKTTTDRPARRHPLRGVVISLIILLAVPATRAMLLAVFWPMLGIVVGIVIALFLFCGGIRIRRY